ncbi:MAG: potassium-transporting ATPase subunit KdpC [Actinomycetota bacterium]|nr:potassium-transporting ATPase subunit KdpC [Actinomycetota bacterium]
MFRYIKSALNIFVLLTVLTGLIYPAAILFVSQTAFSNRANGSLVSIGNKTVGSSLLAQSFQGDQWFQPRPSAVGYSGTTSGPSNLALSNPALSAQIKKLSETYRRQNSLSPSTAVPADAVTESGSGLDPNISLINAELQAPRVAKARSLNLGVVESLIKNATSSSPSYLFGTKTVNVVILNLDLMKLRVR